MLKSMKMCGWAMIVPLFGLGCESMPRNNCCSPCPTGPITSTCAMPSNCSGCVKATPCQQPASCGGCQSASSSGGQSGDSMRGRLGKALRRSNDCGCASACGCASSAGFPSAPMAVPSPAPSPAPAPAPAPTTTTMRPPFDPFAVTQNMQNHCIPCAAGMTASAMPVPSVVTTAQYQHRPTFQPFAVTESLQQAVMIQPAVAQPVAVKKAAAIVLPNTYYHNDDYTSLVGQLHYNPRNDTWRLRYATVDVSDVFGGSVTLVDVGGMMRGLKSGQMVAVEGEVADLDGSSVSPSYRVRRIWPVQQ